MIQVSNYWLFYSLSRETSCEVYEFKSTDARTKRPVCLISVILSNSANKKFNRLLNIQWQIFKNNNLTVIAETLSKIFFLARKQFSEKYFRRNTDIHSPKLDQPIYSKIIDLKVSLFNAISHSISRSNYLSASCTVSQGIVLDELGFLWLMQLEIQMRINFHE